MRGRGRIIAATIGAALIVAGGLGLAWIGGLWRPVDERQPTAEELVGAVHVSAQVVQSSLVATAAVADFGIEVGVQRVNVRIVDELQVEVTITATRQVPLAANPRLCLVGRGSAPDDAGLSDRCWGTPDLSAILAAAMPVGTDGHPLLDPAQPVEVTTTLQRGDVRCDYPPGTWMLVMTIEPEVDGSAAGPTTLPSVPIEVPWETAGPLEFLGSNVTRYCGTASAVYREQGEPPLESAVPSP